MYKINKWMEGQMDVLQIWVWGWVWRRATSSPSGLIYCPLICVSETETDSESTVYYVIGAILYRTLGDILPMPKWVLLISMSEASFSFFSAFLKLFKNSCRQLSAYIFHVVAFTLFFFFCFFLVSIITIFLFPCPFFCSSLPLSNSYFTFSICLLSYNVSIAFLLPLCLLSYQTNVFHLQKCAFP